MDREGRTALRGAAARGEFVETVELLLKAGTDIDAQNTNGIALAAAAFTGALGTVANP
jgi:ankyrin repeat protein